LDSTGERRAIGVLDPLTGVVSEIVTFVLREYYSPTRVYGSAIVRVNRVLCGKPDPLKAGESLGVPCS
jgi:hypothetical protein